MKAKEYLGKEVTVVMDRPMGSKHTTWKTVYPVNYGYIPNTISGDGKELDAFVLGVFEPLETFTGEVKAVVHRTNDDDDKLIVAPKDRTFSREQIWVLIEFQERYFNSEIIWTNGKVEPFGLNGKLVTMQR